MNAEAVKAPMTALTDAPSNGRYAPRRSLEALRRGSLGIVEGLPARAREISQAQPRHGAGRRSQSACKAAVARSTTNRSRCGAHSGRCDACTTVGDSGGKTRPARP